MLVAARFVQGIGGAFSSSVIVAIIVTEFPSPMERAKAMSAYVFVAVGGGSVGLLAGGVLTQVLELALDLLRERAYRHRHAGRRLLPPGGQRRSGHQTGRRLGRLHPGDRVGHGVIYAIVTAATYGWVSAHTLGFLGLGVVLFGGLLRARVEDLEADHAAAHPEAAHAHRLERDPRPAHHRMFSTFFIGALYFEHVLGYSPIKTGLAFLPQAVVMAGMSTGLTA